MFCPFLKVVLGRFIVQDAAQCGGIILSNDKYRDLINESRQMRKAIEEQRLNFNFRNDTLHVAQGNLLKGIVI